MIAIIAARLALIHIGESIHHHDQSIVSVSLSMMNTIVSKPVNPMPLDEDDDVAILVLLVKDRSLNLCEVVILIHHLY